MRKFIVAILLSAFLLPVSAAEFAIPNTQSVKSFSRPYDNRFQYSLPEGKSFSVFSRTKQVKEPQEHFSTSEFEDADDEEEVVLDTKYVAPQKKIIKKLSADSMPKNNNVDGKDMPMNYDAFPKFYDPNDMMNQQFMPMMTY